MRPAACRRVCTPAFTPKEADCSKVILAAGAWAWDGGPSVPRPRRRLAGTILARHNAPAGVQAAALQGRNYAGDFEAFGGWHRERSSRCTQSENPPIRVRPADWAGLSGWPTVQAGDALWPDLPRQANRLLDPRNSGLPQPREPAQRQARGVASRQPVRSAARRLCGAAVAE